MKLLISKSKDGNGYYTKVQNDYNGKHTEKYLPIQLPKGTDIEYGLYDVDGFLSTYEKKDGTVEFKLVVRDLNRIEKNNVKNDSKSDTSTQSNVNPYEDFGKSIKTEVQEQFDYSEEDFPF